MLHLHSLDVIAQRNAYREIDPLIPINFLLYNLLLCIFCHSCGVICYIIARITLYLNRVC